MEEGTRTILLAAGFPHVWWPYAIRYFVFARNITPRATSHDSPYEKRFNSGPFPGLTPPFGLLIHFVPGKRLAKRLGKFEPLGVPGLFMGWKVNNGQYWAKSYLVVLLSDLQSGTHGGTVHVHTVAQITLPVSEAQYQLSLIHISEPTRP